MFKQEFLFWIFLVFALLSAFLGGVLGSILYPTLKQLFPINIEHYFMFLSFVFAICIFYLFKKIISNLIKADKK